MNVLIADDHPLFRMGLRYALAAQGFTVVAEASDGEEALRQCRRTLPDVALLDVKMPRLSGIEVCARLQSENIPSAVVLISTFAEPAIIDAARSAGARGYLSKETDPAVLALSLRRIVSEPTRDWLPRTNLPSLTPRERDVLSFLARGHSNKEIARELGLSPDTVKDHLGRLFAKLGADDRLSLLNRARELGLVS
ncbi:response regulator transcription factor [Deinococcus peraridilitoris]|uniref:Response regulator containing a CheY-like receiver domain and an HTH DNA-binding domain protein n=1 Tax=Deinococcus peraridilitoris (strain DSM 19664 / LMG 22246 / CIP 109416 / KR-200) TaxID=937777 RepID=L0A2A7_DEIPD|nr:response regulator transcription factor [Deinococcus peraridilitoris]AFZ67317.1 response regulator containing a CheY-like receiver domain and an HTH DNA-binding domain protein [Deinococcus peraridilitoris DSM 19664]